MEQNTGTIFATYAAGASTVLSLTSIVWNIFVYRRDSGNIRLNAMIGKIVSQGLYDDKELYLSLTITNVGKRPITVIHIAGSYIPWWGKILCEIMMLPLIEKLQIWQKAFRNWVDFIVIPTGNIPVKLQEGEYLTETYPIKNIDPKSMQKATCLFVVDSRGNKWYLSRRKLKEIKQKLSGL